MEIRLNGMNTRVKPGTNLYVLLADLDLDPETVLVELNQKIIPQTYLAHTELKPGDELELLRFVGGG